MAIGHRMSMGRSIPPITTFPFWKLQNFKASLNFRLQFLHSLPNDFTKVVILPKKPLIQNLVGGERGMVEAASQEVSYKFVIMSFD